LQIKINEALEPMKQEKEEEIKKRINDALIKERKQLNDRQKIEIENIRKQYQKEAAVNITILGIYFMLKLSFCRLFKNLFLIQLLIENV
jgi:F0F1-type ATP synthase assembly protein I